MRTSVGQVAPVVSEVSKLVEIMLGRCVLPDVVNLCCLMPPCSVFVSLGMVRGLGILKKGLCLWESSLLRLRDPGLTCPRLFRALSHLESSLQKNVVIEHHVT